ncbi:MAG: hypothetical protein MI865_04765 [Proteobacteria bacterium]|nr:hypothetical protein [Pseudomonadota bacterium]
MIFGGNKNEEELKQKIEQLEKQNRIMRSALEFYAETKNWEEGHKYRDEDNATIFTDGSESGATVDKGSKAYRALKACDS